MRNGGRNNKTHPLKTLVIEVAKVPKLKNPILIEGLPGIGFVGKLAAEHVIEQLKAKKVAEIYSHHFPHQVLLNKDGTIKMLNNEIYLSEGKGKNKNDLLILVGDVQPTSPEAQYEVMDVILDYFEEHNGKQIITLGGYSTGKLQEKPRVFGSTTDKSTIEKYKKEGIVFGVAEGSIIGAAGLLLGLGKMRGISGICLMGETHGTYIDNRSAQRVLETLSKLLGIEINTEKLIEKAKESEEIIRKMEEETRRAVEGPVPGYPVSSAKPSDLTYIR